MKQYFTSVDTIDNQFVGVVYDSNTNNIIYKTKPYPDQTLATLDIAEYLKTRTPIIPETLPKIKHFNNSGSPQVTTVATTRCCGR